MFKNIWEKNISYYSISLLLLLNIFIWHALFADRALLTVAFLDVGQGDAIYIETPSGNQVLVDGGLNNSVLRELGEVIPYYDRDLDIIIATHPDADHIGGFPEVLHRFEVEHVLTPQASSSAAVFSDFETAVMEEDSRKHVALRESAIDLGDGVLLLVLFPEAGYAGELGNTGSLVAKLIYGDTSALLTGDTPAAIEKYLVEKDREILQSDILKVAHHGSRTSSDPEFVSTVSPAYAVISAGADNRYGHPHEEVLETLEASGAEILCTCENGTVIFESDGKNLEVR